MPLRNRVTPTGEMVAVAARGTMMGNRGIIHDHLSKQLLSRRWQHKAWVCCVLEFKNHQHPIMGKSSYTELFFLDEATAFAAGHRPCAYCRRGDFNAFKRAWVSAQGIADVASLRAPMIDHQIHTHRVLRDRSQVTYGAMSSDLPDGTFVLFEDKAWLVQGKRMLLWSDSGYRLARERITNRSVIVLTPRPVVAAFRHGYNPGVHESASL